MLNVIKMCLRMETDTAAVTRKRTVYSDTVDVAEGVAVGDSSPEFEDRLSNIESR